MVVKCLTFSHFCHCSMWLISLFQKTQMWLMVVFSFGTWLCEIVCCFFNETWLFLQEERDVNSSYIMCAVMVIDRT